MGSPRSPIRYTAPGGRRCPSAAGQWRATRAGGTFAPGRGVSAPVSLVTAAIQDKGARSGDPARQPAPDAPSALTPGRTRRL